MISRQKLKKFFFLLLACSFALFLSASLTRYFFLNYFSAENVTHRLNEKIRTSEKKLDQKILEIKAKLLSNGKDPFFLFPKSFDREFSESGRIFLIYRNDSLVSWTENIFPAPKVLDPGFESERFLFGGNGYYLKLQEDSANFKILGLQLVKYEYRFRNEYLPNGFLKGFHAPRDAHIHLQPGKYNITGSDNTFLFSLWMENQPEMGIFLVFLVFILFVGSFLCLVAALFVAYQFLVSEFGYRSMLILFFILDTIILRAVQFYFRFPAALYELDIFNPVHFASSELLPSLGDFLINAALFLQVTYLLFRNTWLKSLRNLNTGFRKLLLILASILLLLIAFEILYFYLESLIINSSISLRFYNLPELTEYSFVSLLLVVILLFSFNLISEKVSQICARLEKGIRMRALLLLLVMLIYAIYWSWIRQREPWPLLLLGLFLGISFFVKTGNGLEFLKSGKNLVLFLLLALTGTYMINEFTGKREKEQRILIATHLADSRDQLAEFFYKTTTAAMVKDTLIPSMLGRGNADSTAEPGVLDYINNTYFQGFWSKYHIQLTFCHPGKKLSINPGNVITECDTYFNEQISRFLSPVGNSNLYYLNQSIDVTYYLGRVAFSTEKNPFVLYIEIDSKSSNRGQGYPELLMDKSLPSSENLEGYSYAFYNKGDLMRNVGSYAYDVSFNKYDSRAKTNGYFDLNGYSHLVIQRDPENSLIVSFENPGITDSIAPFSYLYLFLLILLALFLLFSGKPFRVKEYNLTFRLRLQIYIVAIILGSSLIIGAFTLLYLNRLNNSKNKDIVKEKINTILVELENKYGDTTIQSGNFVDDLNASLLDLSNSNFTDINVFSPQGHLLASSRPQIFAEGLISQQMNPLSYRKLAEEHGSFVIQQETIGNYRFLSAYTPLRNFENRLIGFINIPFFARQEDLRQEMSRLLATYANLYILIIALAVFLALLVSRYITFPLQMIRNQLRSLRLGGQNAKIAWNKADEIGDLVAEYNRMTDELEKSAALLARSERESAWREMARQVAHEIKNPLTPIKLSMQHLIKAWDDQAPDWENRLKKFSQTLIMQIETLSAIATEFSDFAQMPKPNLRRLDIQPVISFAAQLFRDVENVSISCPSETGTFWVYADENQMLRIFNNLIKNAIQAIPADRKGLIHIAVEQQESACLIRFSDNGSGIPTDQQIRIFSPNFTTKSAGMGLGLAMVKNIVDHSGGRIWFESTPDQGTTFFILLPSNQKE